MNGETGNNNLSDLQSKSALAHSSLPLHNTTAFLSMKLKPQHFLWRLLLLRQLIKISSTGLHVAVFQKPARKHNQFSDQKDEWSVRQIQPHVQL